MTEDVGIYRYLQKQFRKDKYFVDKYQFKKDKDEMQEVTEVKIDPQKL